MQEKLKEILAHFGKIKQVLKLQEEYNEFLYAVDEGNIEEIQMELVDLIIMVEQMKIAFPDANREKKIEYKINRTLERIASGYYEAKND